MFDAGSLNVSFLVLSSSNTNYSRYHPNTDMYLQPGTGGGSQWAYHWLSLPTLPPRSALDCQLFTGERPSTSVLPL